MTDVFDALGAPARRAIVDELCDRNGQTLYELCVRLTMKHDLALTRQAVSQHLDVLEAAGLVATERQGRYKLHHLDLAPLQTIVDRWTKANRRGGEREDRRDERPRGRPGKSAAVLHRRARLREEA